MGDTGRRALVAALLGMLGASFGVAGVGHAYLREWRRGVAWFTFVLGAFLVLVSVFTDTSTPTDVNSLPVVVLAPVVVLLSLSVFDAYYLARRGPTSRSNPDAVTCPHCGGEVDADLQFCHWCTEPLSSTQPGESQIRN